VHLATDVFRVLTERETIFASHHYELLVTTYLNADDLPSALSIIMIMVDAKLKVTTETCQPLFLYMRQEIPNEANRPIAAFNLLQDLEASGRKVPTAAINACMQASIALDRFEEAIEIYKALHTVSHAGPDTQTFNILFKGCHEKGRKELAMFFANEMIQLGLRPDRLTYDRLICVCMQGDDWEDALKYYEEMRSTPAKPGSEEKMQPRKKTWEGMIFKAIGKDDVRVVALLKDYMEHQEEPRIALERAVRQRFEEGRPVRRDDGVAEEGRDVAGPVQEQTYEQQPPLTEKDQRAKDAADVYEQLMGGQK
jgi:pentatricopeptide repeat protein